MIEERYLYGIGGLVLGAALGTLGTSLYLEKRYETLIDSEIADVKKAYSQEAAKEYKQELEPESAIWLAEMIEEKTLYHKMISEEGYTEEEPPRVVVPEEQRHYTPYPIDLDQWQEENGYEKVTLAYFIGDDSVVDGADRPLDEPANILGTQFREWFGYLSEDNDCVFIRNESLQMDIEVMREEGTYLDALGGY